MRPLQGKTVLITGGTAGIGKACAKAMLAAGAEAVVINGRERDILLANAEAHRFAIGYHRKTSRANLKNVGWSERTIR